MSYFQNSGFLESLRDFILVNKVGANLQTLQHRFRHPWKTVYKLIYILKISITNTILQNIKIAKLFNWFESHFIGCLTSKIKYHIFMFFKCSIRFSQDLFVPHVTQQNSLYSEAVLVFTGRVYTVDLVKLQHIKINQYRFERVWKSLQCTLYTLCNFTYTKYHHKTSTCYA